MWKHSIQMTFCLFFLVTLALMGSVTPQGFTVRPDFGLPTMEMNCSESCGEAIIPYPFYTKSRSCGRDGFKLECINNSTLKLKVGKLLYNVTGILNNGVILDIVNPSCSPNLESFRIEGNTNFAISKDNFIQFSSCNNRTSCQLKDCNLPYVNVVQCKVVDPCCFSLVYDSTWEPGITNFDRFSSWQCSKFISWGFQGGTNYTSIVGLKLEWGIPGTCKDIQCDKNAFCEAASDVKNSVRCICKDGFQGDGYVEGTGCIEVCERGGKVLYGTDCSDADETKIRKSMLIAGVVIASTLIVGAALLQILVIRKRRSNRRERKNKLARLLPSLQREFTTQLFSYQTLHKATKGFDDAQKCGHGAFGAVYAGTLTDGRRVAVKRIHNTTTFSHEGSRQLLNEISLLSTIEHPSLVRLLGCCLELEDPILVYEFVPNGTLAHHLHRDQTKDRLLPLDWRSRCNIAVDASEALAYLHSLTPPVYHRDVKSSNILLDYSYNCKVGDFGLSRVGPFDDGTHISTAPQGTPGYLDPEYNQTYQLTDKSDVYSFGVVLIELITAMKPVDFSRERKEINLATLAVSKILAHTLDDIIDPYLYVTVRPRVREMVQKIAELAFRCLAAEKDNRPTMREVAQELLAVKRESEIELDQDFLFHTAPAEIPNMSSSASDCLLWPSISTIPSSCTIPSISTHFDSSNNSTRSDIG